MYMYYQIYMYIYTCMYTLTHNNYNMLTALRINCINNDFTSVALSNTKLKKMINVSHHLINDNV